MSTFDTDNGQLYYIDDGKKPNKSKKADAPTPEEPTQETEAEPKRIWLSAMIHVRALALDDNGEWGKLLEWNDHNGNLVRWVMAARYLVRDDFFIPELLKRGLHLTDNKDKRSLLRMYLNRQTPFNRARLVSRLGWQDDCNVYVMPDATYGDTQDIEYLPLDVNKNPYTVSGTVAEWIEHVGKFCVGNSRLIFAASTTLASPLLRFTHDQNTIIHLTGPSSTGKTTGNDVGTSVAGAPQNIRFSWHNTINGFEGNCAERNDGAINLDEIGQVDPRVAGDVVYMIANGSGKGSMNRDRTLRAVKRWRMLAVSSGEIGLVEKMQMADKHVFAGQELRLLDIPVDAGMGMGIIETLHGFATANALIKTLNDNVALYHGAVFREFLRQIAAAEPEELATALRQQRDAFAAEVVPIGASAQVTRAAHIFGLISVAGQLASVMGLTGWSPADAKDAAIKCFNAWLIKREHIDDLETARGLEQVSRIIKTQDHRFHQITFEFDTPNRLGFKECVNDQWEYYVYPEAWKNEVCRGYNAQHLAKEMIERGWMRKGDGRNLAVKKGCGRGYGQLRMYHITGAAFKEPDQRTPEQQATDARDNVFRNMGYDDE